MKRSLLISEFLATPWAMMPERLAAVTSVMSRWSRGDAATQATLEQAAADQSARNARRQVLANSAGKFKVEYNPYAPLDGEARSFLQSRTDDSHYGAELPTHVCNHV